MTETITVELTVRDRQIIRHALAVYLQLGLYDCDEVKQLALKVGIPVVEKKEGDGNE